MQIEVMAEGEGLAEVTLFQFPEGATGEDLIVAVAEKGGFPAGEALVFFEDQEEPLDRAAPLVGYDKSGQVHHVHRAKLIRVTVFYKDEHKFREFRPAARVQRVLDWAVGSDGFNIDPAIAPEMELALQGENTALPKEAHIGRFVQHPQHTLALDLIRGVVPNGSVR